MLMCIPAKAGLVNIASVLAWMGADLESRTDLGDTPLITASRCNHTDVIQLLCDWHADVNARNYKATTALHFAVENNNVSSVKIFLKHNAELYRNYEGKTPLDKAEDLNLSEIVCLLENCIQKESQEWATVSTCKESIQKNPAEQGWLVY